MTSVAEPDEGQFSELVAFLRHSAEFLMTTIRLLLKLGVRNKALSSAMADLEGVIRRRSEELIASVQSHDFDDQLARHGLGNDSPDWRFKLAGYQAAVESFETRNVDESSSFGKIRKALHPIKSVLGWMNVALRSIASAIPGVGGAYNEIKDGIEAAIDTVSEEPGVVMKAVRLLSPRNWRPRRRRPKPEESPTPLGS